jgi:hypothetical protein
MRRLLPLLTVAAVLTALAAGPAPAQNNRATPAKQGPAAAAKPAAATALTAAQILDKSVEASGGRAAYDRYKTVVMTGKIEIPGQGLTGTLQVFSKAPNKQVTVMALGGVFNATQGFDGQTAWSSDSMQGTRVLTGVEAAVQRRTAVFGADARWRDLWQGAELAGSELVKGVDTYAVKMLPKPGEGQPVTTYFDKATFLPVRSDMVQEGPQGTIPVQSYLSDYRAVGGLKVPFTIEQQLAAVTMKVTFTDVQFDVPIDDAKFVKPN